MIRIEFKLNGIVLWHDFALTLRAIEFYRECKKLGLSPLMFELSSECTSIEDQIAKHPEMKVPPFSPLTP